MLIKRALNNDENKSLKIVKDSGLYYDLKYFELVSGGVWAVDIPSLQCTYFLDKHSAELLSRDLNSIKK